MQPPATLAWHQDKPLKLGDRYRSLKNNYCPGPFSSPRLYPIGLFQAGAWTGQNLLTWSPRLESYYCLCPLCLDPELDPLTVTAAKAAHNLHIPNQFFCLNISGPAEHLLPLVPHSAVARVCKSEAFPVVWRWLHLPLLPDEVVCTRQPPWCHPMLICLWSVSPLLAHYLSQAEFQGLQLLSHREGSSPPLLLACPYSPRFCVHPLQQNLHN